MILSNLNKIFRVLDKKEKLLVLTLFFFTILSSILEFLSISTIVPLIQQIIGGFENNFILKTIYRVSGYEGLYNKDTLIIIIILIIIIFFTKNLVFMINSYLSNFFSFKVRYRLLNKLYEQYLKKDYNFFLNKNSNELIRNRDTVSAIGYGSLIYLQILNNSFLAISLISAFILFLDIKLILVVIFFILFLILYYFFLKNRIEKISKKEQIYAFFEIKNFQQTFKGIKEILASGKILNFLLRYNEITKKQKYMNITLSTIPEISKYFIEIITVTILCLAIIYLNNSIGNLSLVLGQLSIIFIISLRLFPILNKILQLSQKLNVLYGKLKIFFNEFSVEEEEKVLLKKNFSIKRFNKIELKKINFKYNKNSKKNIINNFSLTINKKEILGISGSSGKGKSTLIDIILGLLKIDSGKILIDGKNKKNYVISCSYVSQFDYLLDDTIKNNINIFSSKKKINIKKIKFLLSIVKLDKLIEQLPHKLDSQVGEYGKNFSGGQMQRISLVRSMYAESELIVFDEPTNMLDKKTSIEIFKKIIQLLKHKKTVIIISHDKRILNFCDKVIYL